MFVDTLPIGTTLVPNSIMLDGVPISGSNPISVTVQNLLKNNTSTIIYSVKVDSIPSINKATNYSTIYYNYGTIPYTVDSNTVTTTISYVTDTVTKSVDYAYADLGTILTYTIAIKNSGNTQMNNIVLIDTIINETTIIPNSLKQDSTNVTIGTNPINVTLPNSILENSTSTITYKILVNSVPTTNSIINIGNYKYAYTVVQTTINDRTGSNSTNSVETKIRHVDLSGIKKSVNENYTTNKNKLVYTIVIPNKGNISVTNVRFFDTIPSGTTFVTDSVKVNGQQRVGETPAFPGGILLNTIGSGETVTITFEVIVD